MTKPVTDSIRAERRVAADKRNAEYSKLSLDEKIALQEKNGYTGKQLTKLMIQKATSIFQAEHAGAVEENKITTTGKLTQEQKIARKVEHKKNVKNLNKDR